MNTCKTLNNHLLFVLLVLFASPAFAKKKLVIHKCLQSNGTIAYLEDPCVSKQTTIHKRKKKPKFKANPSYTAKNITKNPTIKTFARLKNTNFKDNSTKILSNVAKGYHFSIKVLKRWQTSNVVYNNKLVHMKFSDFVPQAEMFLMIDFIFPDNKIFSTAELQELVALVGSRYIKGSKEGAVIPYELKVKNGKGVLATFTHSNRVTDYKFATRGAIFKGKWLVQFTLLSNSLQSQGYLFALNSLTKSIEIH